MNEQPWMAGPPGRILIATDLSARCDRALDRAVQLATAWAAQLVVLTVLETQRTPDEIDAWMAGEDDDGRERFMRRQLAREIAGLPVPVETLVRDGDVAERTREVAESEECGLVVTGVARSENFGRFFVGATVERLARVLPQPLLVVRNRAWGPYHDIVVATDFSDASQNALQAAIHLFPESEFTLYHAFGSSDNPDDEAVRRVIEQGECADFLASAQLPAAVRERLRVVIERGGVEIALPRYAKGHDVDLVVLGTHGRSHFMNVLLGRSAAQLLDWLPCDSMLVRRPRSAG